MKLWEGGRKGCQVMGREREIVGSGHRDGTEGLRSDGKGAGW